ncbi:MAG: hypothetical protein HQM10_16090 [Candidatus Riflebacteria bacterium]|nr:hypothetical protein [Candidatus Riflebacteria bacterium]
MKIRQNSYLMPVIMCIILSAFFSTSAEASISSKSLPSKKSSTADSSTGEAAKPFAEKDKSSSAEKLDSPDEMSCTSFISKITENNKIIVLIILFFVSAELLYNFFRKKSPESFYVRHIPALDAIDSILGMSAETGKSVLFVPGIKDVEDMQTMAAMNLLGKISEKSSILQVPVFVPVSHSFTMTVAQDVVKRSFINVSKPYKEALDRVTYLSDDQLAFAAGVIGIMNRDNPAACFFFGNFLAESLLLSESAAAIGCVSIGGTAETSQIPFFIVSCDYTIIGEELFAASACVSKSEKDLATLRTLDMIKLISIAVILAGCIIKMV